jgi:hypothetical protein
MDDSKIKMEHLFQWLIVVALKIQKGTKMRVNDCYTFGGEKEITIDWINPHYFWFGDKDKQIQPRDIISIDGADEREKISAIRKEIFRDELALQTT